jgi:PKD repeat protein
MKPNIIISNFRLCQLAAVLLLAAAGCTPDLKDTKLGPLPTAEFEILPGADANSVVLVNKTSGPSVANWSTSTGGKFTGDTARVKFIFEGTYDVTLLVAAQGGLDSLTKQVTINQSDPNACDPANAIGFIAGCTQKTWKLNPDAGAYKVGPGADNGNWWSSGAGEVGGRACEFNDEYTFSFNAAGTFVYDNKGDFYGDGYIGNGNGCQPNSNMNATQAPWGSATSKFTVIENAGVRGLGQLKVVGLGAHIGLQKVHNGGETTSGPIGTSITYDILERTINAGGSGHDILKVGTNIGGDGWWTFTLRSN